MHNESGLPSLFSIWSKPERIRARFNFWYQGKETSLMRQETNVTPEDVDKYATIYPEEGRRLDKMLGHTKATGAGLALGFVGSLSQTYRITKSPPLIICGTVMGTFTGMVLGDDIGSLVYGTYKFDTLGTSTKFYEWMTSGQKEQSS